VGRCPECGGEYNAQPLGMRGILIPQDLRIPWGDFIRFVLCAAVGLLLMYAAVVEGRTWAYVPAVVLLVFGLLFLYLAARQTQALWRHRALLRRAVEYEESAGD
jgi:hypothetical protein